MDASSEQTFNELYEAAGIEAARDVIKLEQLEIAQRGGAALKATMMGNAPDNLRIYRAID